MDVAFAFPIAAVKAKSISMDERTYVRGKDARLPGMTNQAKAEHDAEIAIAR